MKKVSALLFCFSLIFPSFLVAQDDTIMEEEEFTYEYDETTIEKKGYSHWSLMAKAGISLFDGDIPQGSSIFPESRDKFALGAELEYSFNPRWGLILEYMYLPIGAKTDNVEFTGKVHTPALLFSANLANLFYSHRSERPRWNVYVNVGPAISFYSAESTHITEGDNDVSGLRAASIVVGLSAEYNFHRSWAVNLSGQYRMQSKDDFEGVRAFQGNSKDNLANVTLGVRYKLNCRKRINHVRNIDYATYDGANNMVINNITERMDALERRVSYVEDNMVSRAEIQRVNQRVKDVEDFIENEFGGPDSDGDGVPDSRDRHPNTPQGSYVNYWGEPLPLSEIDNTPAVYFGFDSYALTAESKNVIREIALHMSQHSDVKLEIRGYADNIGSTEYNLDLSKKRALAVKKELVQVYKIDESRITANGLGKVSNTKLGRRCDFFYDK